MTILQKILAWLAGQSENLPETNVRTESLLEAAARKIKSGLLPAATDADAGKIVMIDNRGNYTLAEAGGGANVLRLNILYSDRPDATVTGERLVRKEDNTNFASYDEAKAAIESADIIQLKCHGSNPNNLSTFYYPAAWHFQRDSNHRIVGLYIVYWDTTKQALSRQLYYLFYYNDN